MIDAPPTLPALDDPFEDTAYGLACCPDRPEEDWAERHLRVLGRLTELGMNMLEALDEKLSGRAGSAQLAALAGLDGQGLAQAHGQFARSVRLTLMFESKIRRARVRQELQELHETLDRAEKQMARSVPTGKARPDAAGMRRPAPAGETAEASRENTVKAETEAAESEKLPEGFADEAAFDTLRPDRRDHTIRRFCAAFAAELNRYRMPDAAAPEEPVETGQKAPEMAQIRHCLEQAIEAQADAADVEALRARLGQRLDAEEYSGRLGRHPIAEIIFRLCRDLGIHYDLDLWLDQSWAQKEARKFEAGHPLDKRWLYPAWGAAPGQPPP